MPRKLALIALPLFLICQTVAVRAVAGGERVPPKPDFARFPSRFGDWRQTGEEPIEPAVAEQLGADRWLYRDYFEPGANVSGSLFVAWFQSQRGGASQPHSPQVCLPGSGWVFAQQAVEPLAAPPETITVNQDIISQGAQRAAVVYWYLTPRHAVASEWSAKFWTVADAVRERRTDTSMVRVVVFNANRSDQETMAAARDLAARSFAPLRELLPEGR